MNIAIIILTVITVIFTISIIVFLLLSINSKAYLTYKKKLLAFEEKKRKIEDEIENDRKGFKHGS